MAKIDTVTMFTSEIAVAELNTLRDEVTYVIPREFKVTLVELTDRGTEIRLTRIEE